jgi:hypothetical protein
MRAIFSCSSGSIRPAGSCHRVSDRTGTRIPPEDEQPVWSDVGPSPSGSYLVVGSGTSAIKAHGGTQCGIPLGLHQENTRQTDTDS